MYLTFSFAFTNGQEDLDFIPQIYKFTNSDVQELRDIGYEFVPKNTDSLTSLMQTRFPNFNLSSLLRVVERQFSGTTNKRIIRTLEFDESANTLQIDYRNDFINEDDALLFIRKFSVIGRAISVNHLYCVIPKNSRNNGLIKPVFQESLQQYVNVNARKILVHAGLSGGGYTWAKYGFYAIHRNEVDVILQRAKRLLKTHKFNFIKNYYDKYYSDNPKGKAFPVKLWADIDYMRPVLMGSDWHGELDLKNKEQFRNFKDYVSR